jgi:hypothetical protein
VDEADVEVRIHHVTAALPAWRVAQCVAAEGELPAARHPRPPHPMLACTGGGRVRGQRRAAEEAQAPPTAAGA